jgi:glycerol-1-phosphate dehydrogenase [NAD(P)+]
MSILARNVLLPVFMCVEKNASRKVGALLQEKNLKFSRALIVTGKKALHKIALSAAGHLPGRSAILTVEKSTAKEVEAAAKRIDAFGAEVVIGIGGGVALDVAKCAASEKGVSFVSMPTAVSNDGIASPIAVISSGNRTRSLNTHMPVAVVADLSIIAKSPARNTRSGVGDLISNLSACADWRLAYGRKKDQIDDFAETISRSSAMRLLSAEKRDIHDMNFLKILIEGLIMSGIAMGIHGSSRPSSGAEHMISHALDRLFRLTSTHGEQAGLATLFTLSLHRMDISGIRQLYRSLKMVKQPEDIGISKKEFLKAVRIAPNMRPGRYSILDESTPEKIAQAYEKAYESA